MKLETEEALLFLDSKETSFSAPQSSTAGAVSSPMWSFTLTDCAPSGFCCSITFEGAVVPRLGILPTWLKEGHGKVFEIF